jgi:hypothetical protein
MAEFINTIDVLGDDAVIDSIIDRTITEFKDGILTELGTYAFANCTDLQTVSLPSVTKVYDYAFANCVNLKTPDLPNLVSIYQYAFEGCTSLVEVDLPVAGLGKGAFNKCTALKSARFEAVTRFTSAETNQFAGCSSLIDVFLPNLVATSPNMFNGCASLEKISLPSLTALSANTFFNCKSLKAVILPNETLVTIGAINAFAECYRILGTVDAIYNPNGLKDGYIYVPRALVDSYKAATNWSTYASQFRALEDYTVDGTTTGKLAAGVIHYDLQYMLSSNAETFVLSSYRTTLTVLGKNPFVSVTMDGVDITTDVYNSETHEIVIPLVAGDIVITATAEFDNDATSIYELPAPTTFNGTSHYIDTGIKLFDTPKDFTIVCSADFSALGNNICLLHCMKETQPYPGLSVDGNSGVRISYTGASATTTSITNKNNVSALALRFKAGVLDAIRYKDTSGNIVTVAHSTGAKYTAITQNLLLGAYQTTDGTKGRYYKGTVESFRVFGISLPDEIITDELQMA